jgi:predicted nucleic acid-binding protein
VRTAIDANIFSAILNGEPTVPRLLAQLENAMHEGALLISPFVFAELLAHPGQTEANLRKLLVASGVLVDLKIEERVWTIAGLRYAQYAARRRKATGESPRRILADFLIGAHSLVQADRLLTLDPRRYRQDFPELRLL